MNERIRELVRESHLDVYGLGKERYKWEYTVGKFAELLVRKCADVLDNQIAPPNHPMNSLGHKLKKHFGVEE